MVRNRLTLLTALLVLALAALCACSPSNAPASGRAALNQQAAREVDAIDTSLKKATTAEEEKAAFSQLNHMCLDSPMSYTLALTDSRGVSIDFSEWEQHRAELTGGTIDINIVHPAVGLEHTIHHRLIDPVNIVFLLGE